MRNRWKGVVRCLLKPPLVVKLLLTPLSAILLACAFTVFDRHSPWLCWIYVLSAYTLTVDVLAAAAAWHKLKAWIYGNQFAARYMSELEFRVRVSLYAGVGATLVYAMFNVVTGIMYQSPWMGAIGVYYEVLCIIRVTLLTRAHNAGQQNREQRERYEVKSYRQCGFLLLILTVTMGGMMIQMIWQNRSFRYPGYMIYAHAAYAFYRLPMTVINLLRLERRHAPVLAAAKAMDLASALMALFALQTAMFSQFGGEDQFQRIMNLLTGGFVCSAGIGLAAFMIRRANQALRSGEESQCWQREDL